MRKCTINIKEKDYDLVITRDSIKWLEANGFSIEEFNRKPVTYYDMLWHVGFIANYPSVHANLAEKLRESYIEEEGDDLEIIKFVIEEYTTFMSALTDTSSKKKKATITVA